MGDKQVAECITLLEEAPFPDVIKNLGLKKTWLSLVFNEPIHPIVRAESKEVL